MYAVYYQLSIIGCQFFLTYQSIKPMAINLEKGQGINLDKNTHDLSEIIIGLGWDVVEEKAVLQRKETKENFFTKFKNIIGLGNATGRKYMYSIRRNNPMMRKEETKSYDLDAIAFLLDDTGKVKNLGSRSPLESGQVVDFIGSDIIFYNNPKSTDGAVIHTGDNRTGEGEGDDEQIVVKLASLDASYKKIVFIACIYQGVRKNQHFGLIENAFVRAVDAQGREIAKFNLSRNEAFNNKRTIIFAEVVRTGGTQGWRFQAVGDALDTDRFGEVLKKYLP
jgi:stress response protein SCP2